MSTCNCLPYADQTGEGVRSMCSLGKKLSQLLDCGQDVVCEISPGCIRHWAERNKEISDELAKSKANEAKLRERMEEIALTGNLSITDAQDMARKTLTEIDKEETK